MKKLNKLFNGTISIDFENVKINSNIMIKILDLFTFENLLILIDFLEKDSYLFKIFEKENIRYITENKHGVNKKYTNCAIILSRKNINVLRSNDLLNADLYVMGINNISKLDECLDSLSNISNKLIKKKLVDFIVDFWNSEKCINITADSTNYQKNIMTKEIKKILHQSE